MRRGASNRHLHRLTRRQCKKLRLGEFTEHSFVVRVRFAAPLSDAAHDAFAHALYDHVASLGMYLGGLGGRMPLFETEAIVCRNGRAPLGEDDRAAVVRWLRGYPAVAQAEAEAPGGYAA